MPCARRYAVANGHSGEDLAWLFKSRTTPGVYSAASGGAWQTIAKALPDRTTQQVWACGTRIMHPNNYKVRSCAHRVLAVSPPATTSGRVLCVVPDQPNLNHHDSGFAASSAILHALQSFSMRVHIMHVQYGT